MKRVLCVLMVLLLSVALVGCGKTGQGSFTPTISVCGEAANVAFPLSKADASSLRTMLGKVTWEVPGEANAPAAEVTLSLNDGETVEVSLGDNMLLRTSTGEQAPLPAEMAELIRAIIGESRVESMTALCETAIAMLPEDVVLFKASAEEVTGAIPGLGEIAYKELCAYFPPVYGYGCEVVMVSVEDEDVAATEQLFRDYIDKMANDTDYPDNAEGWKNHATVSVNGNIVTLCCLPEGVDAPDALLGRF